MDQTKRRRRPRGTGSDPLLNVRVPPAVRQAIHDRARAEGVTASDVMRRLVTEYLGLPQDQQEKVLA